MDGSRYPVPQSDRIDNVTGARLAAAYQEQTGDLAGQGFAVNDQIVEAGIQEVQIRELAYRTDHGVHSQGELASRDCSGAAPATCVYRHPLACLGQLYAANFPIL